MSWFLKLWISLAKDTPNFRVTDAMLFPQRRQEPRTKQATDWSRLGSGLGS